MRSDLNSAKPSPCTPNAHSTYRLSELAACGVRTALGNSEVGEPLVALDSTSPGPAARAAVPGRLALTAAIDDVERALAVCLQWDKWHHRSRLLHARLVWRHGSRKEARRQLEFMLRWKGKGGSRRLQWNIYQASAPTRHTPPTHAPRPRDARASSCCSCSCSCSFSSFSSSS